MADTIKIKQVRSTNGSIFLFFCRKIGTCTIRCRLL